MELENHKIIEVSGFISSKTYLELIINSKYKKLCMNIKNEKIIIKHLNKYYITSDIIYDICNNYYIDRTNNISCKIILNYINTHSSTITCVKDITRKIKIDKLLNN